LKTTKKELINLKTSGNEIIRATLTYLLVISVLTLSFLTATYPIYLDVIKNLSLPLTMVLGGWFAVHTAKNIKKTNESK